MWRFLKKLEIELPYDPAIPLLGIHTEETRSERDTCTPRACIKPAFEREGNGNPLQYSCLENPMDRGAWRATVHEITESDTTEWLTLPLLLVRLVFLSLLFS